MGMRTNARFTVSLVPLVFVAAGGLWLIANQDTSAETTSDGSQPSRPAATLSPQPTPTCPPEWRIQGSPNGSSPGSALNGMVSLAINNVWAVGATSTNSTSQTLIEHWDGTTWTIVPGPNRGSGPNTLFGVTAESPSDLWAVGAASGILIMHYDGVSWSTVPTPDLGATASLASVAALSPTEAWAVGTLGDTSNATLILHWDGITWTRQASPSIGTGSVYLQHVDMSSATDVWAVGDETDTTGVFRYTLALHWDGMAWTRVSTPNPGFEQQFLYGLNVESSTGAWAVGYYHDTGSNPVWRTLIIRWNGAMWQQVASPDVGMMNFLYCVRAAPPGDLWAVGSYKSDANAYSAPLIEHFDGVSWSVMPAQVVPGVDSSLSAVDICVSNHPRAVGSQSLASATSTLIEEYTHECLPPTMTPVASPTLTMTPCTVNFTDVQPGDYFYSDVQCVYCRGAVSGYGDGTFRPYANTTRGQMAKIITLALRIPIMTPTGSPRFVDVPASNPFYPYVETLATDGVVSGYPDGTFRPNADVTRGELSKIDTLAANLMFGWALLDPVSPTFSDVPVDSPFYSYIETASCHGVVSGYADGTFLPGNNAIRAQIAKIVCRTSQNPTAPCMQASPMPTPMPTMIKP